jgi:hypothetical protein
MSSYAPLAQASSNLPPTSLDSATLNSLMFCCGWVPSSGGGWTRPTAKGPAELTPVPAAGVYPELELRGGAAMRTTPSKHLRANAGLAGPAKFVVPRGCRRPVCRCTLPAFAGDFVTDSDRVLDDPHQFLSWVSAVSELVAPSSTLESSDLDFQALAEHLKSCGWNAESGPERTMVHVQRRGLYSQIVLDRHPNGGWRIGADLIGLSEVSPASRRAAVRIASVANRRLPLTRFSAQGSVGATQLRCEVHLGHGLVSKEWLLAATEAVEAGVVLTVRELQAAVRDTALAELVVAAPAA